MGEENNLKAPISMKYYSWSSRGRRTTLLVWELRILSMKKTWGWLSHWTRNIEEGQYHFLWWVKSQRIEC